jgi:hypothetical protein
MASHTVTCNLAQPMFRFKPHPAAIFTPWSAMIRSISSRAALAICF